MDFPQEKEKLISAVQALEQAAALLPGGALDALAPHLAGLRQAAGLEGGAPPSSDSGQGLFHPALKALPGIAYDFDPVSGKILRSQGLLDLVGVRAEDAPVTLDWWLGRVHPADLSRLQQAFQEMETSPVETFSAEYRVRHEDGRWICVYDNCFVQRDATGRPVRLSGISLDVTARRRAESNDRLLVALGERLVRANTADEAVSITVERLGQHLDADRCVAASIDPARRLAQISPDYSRGLPSMQGSYALDSFPAELVEMFRAGHAFAVDNLRSNPRTAGVFQDDSGLFNCLSFIVVPAYLQGRWAGALAAAAVRPRAWAADEIHLLESVSSLLWLALEKIALLDDLRERERLLARSEERFRMASEAMNEGLWEIDMVSGQMWWNEHYDRLYGPRPPSTGSSVDWWLERVHQDDRERVQASFNEAIQSAAGQWVCEYRFRRANGLIAHVFDRASIARDASGRAVRITGSMLDLTVQQHMTEALRESEAALRLSESRFKLALSSSPVIVFATDRHMPYTWFYNAPFDAAALIGRTDEEIMGAEAATPLTEVKRHVLETGETIRKEMIFSVDGQPKVYDCTYEAKRDALGRITGIAGAAVDITEKRQLETREVQFLAQVEVQRRLLEQREMERQQIARELHDGPLQNLIALIFDIQAALPLFTRRQQRAPIERLRAQAQGLVNELREVTYALRPPGLIQFGLEGALRSHIEEFNRKNLDLPVRFTAEGPFDGLPKPVALALYRICQEALNNIARHAGPTAVAVRLSADDRQVTLQVEDGGVGFTPPENWLDLARAGHLGLVGMRERAEAAGGSIALSTRPGQGTCLTVTMPRRARDAV